MVDSEVTASTATGRSSQVSLEDPGGKKTVLGGGAEGSVRRVTTTVEKNGKTRELNLVHKQFQNPESIKIHMDAYRELKRLGLPVPPTFRETPDGILMTDLSDNGKNLVLSYNDLNRRRLYYLRQEAPQLFKQFDGLNLQDSNKLMEQVLQKASQNGVDFDNVDSWTFVMQPDGSYSFMVSDLLNVKLNSPKEGLDERNERSFETFNLMLSESQDVDDSPRDILTSFAKE